MRPPRRGDRVVPDPVGVRFACPPRTTVFPPHRVFSTPCHTSATHPADAHPTSWTADPRVRPVRPPGAMHSAEPTSAAHLIRFGRRTAPVHPIDGRPAPPYPVHPVSPEASDAHAVARAGSGTAIIGV